MKKYAVLFQPHEIILLLLITPVQTLGYLPLTYMLITAQGDIKSVQGNTGHADGKMIVDVYAEVVDDERKVHAQKLDNEFLKDDVLLNVLDRFEKGEHNTFRENSTAGSDEFLKALMVLQSNPEELQRILGMAENGI